VDVEAVNDAGEPAKCWKCQLPRERSWFFCANCGARLRDIRTPHPSFPERDVHFIEDLYSFAWYNHQVMSVALYENVMNVEDFYEDTRLEIHRPMVEKLRAQCIFRTKLFAEEISLFEVFGVLCIMLRKRKTQSMIWTFLNSDPQDVTQFYQAALEGDKPVPLTRLLKFPSPEEILGAVTATKESELQDFKPDPSTYAAMQLNLRYVAEMYRRNEGVNVHCYNRIKHVFPVVEGQGWIRDMPEKDAVAVIVEDSRVLQEGSIGLCKLSMKQEAAELEMVNIQRLTQMGAELLAMAIALQKRGILY